MVRLDPDLAFMLAEIHRQTGVTAPEFLDPLIRPTVMTAFARLLPALKQMAETSEEVRARLAEYERLKVEVGKDYKVVKKRKKPKPRRADAAPDAQPASQGQ